MPSKNQYRIYTETKWMAQAGNAALAIVNKANSGKKISIYSFEVYNNTRLGVMQPADTQAALPSYFKVGHASSVGGGRLLTPAKLDTAAPTFPATIEVKTGAGFVISDVFFSKGVCKGFGMTSPAINTNIGILNRQAGAFGLLWSRQCNSVLQGITIREGEAVAIYCDVVNASIPIYFEAMVIVNGSPNRSYSIAEFVNVVSNTNAILTVENKVGSGLVIQITDIEICETGSYDTPYLQLVPIGQVDANTYIDPNKKVSVVKTDTAADDLLTTVCEIFTNTPMQPFGVPYSYIAEASGGSPKGFNYLNTKDFVGPQYMTYFPEQAGYKTAGTTSTPGTFGHQMSMPKSRIKGFQAPIVLRQGEGLALVAGAETAVVAAGASVSLSGWLSLEFGILMVVEDACTVLIKVVDKSGNPIQNARVLVRRNIDSYDIMNVLTDVNGYATGTYNYQGDANVTVRIRKSTPPSTRYQSLETLGTILSSGYSLTAVMYVDDVAT